MEKEEECPSWLEMGMGWEPEVAKDKLLLCFLSSLQKKFLGSRGLMDSSVLVIALDSS